MRLISVETFQLVEFPDKDAPKYAILSHTWGHDSEELSFSDVRSGHIHGPGVGAVKLRGCCQQAKEDGLEYAWIDTCCIDKTNLVELNEAINSMFRWYSRASVCYAYLSDVPDQPKENLRRQGSSFWESRWFRRGWTLQELLAPKNLRFYNEQWSLLGTKGSLAAAVEGITGVGRPLLLGITNLSNVSVAQRMAWAAQRETKREEDLAYCLLGVFGVTMPLIYGEGGRQAFLRLQEQIMKTTADDSILAWGSIAGMADSMDAPGGDKPSQAVGGQVLASKPSDFSHSKGIVRIEQSSGTWRSLEISGGHLRIHLSILKTSEGGTLGLLNCSPANDAEHVFGIPLAQTESGSSDEFVRPVGSRLVLRPAKLMSDSLLSLIHIKNSDGGRDSKGEDKEQHYWSYDEDEFENLGLQITQVEPPPCWEEGQAMISSAYRSEGSDGDAFPLLVRLRDSTGDATQDFVLALDLDRSVSPSVCRFFIVVCSRETSLQTLCTNIQHIMPKASGCTSASNGSLNLLIRMERDAGAHLFTIRPQKTPRPPDVTIDASKEMTSLYAVSLIEASEKKAELQGQGQRVHDPDDRRQIRVEIQKMAAERERIGESRRARTARKQANADASINLHTRHHEIERLRAQASIDDKTNRVYDIHKHLHAQRQTSLHLAAGNGLVDDVRIPLYKGASGQTVWSLAVGRGHMTVAQAPIEGEADIANEACNGLTTGSRAVDEHGAVIGSTLCGRSDRNRKAGQEQEHPSIANETCKNAISKQGGETIECFTGGSSYDSTKETKLETPRKGIPDTTVTTDGKSDGEFDMGEISRNIESQGLLFRDSENSFTLGSHENEEILSMAVSCDPIMLASATEKMIRLWDVTSRKCLQRIETPHSTLEDLAISPNAKLIAATFLPAAIKIWNVTTRQIIERRSNDWDGVHEHIEFSPNSSLLASTSTHGIIKLWYVSEPTEESSHSTLEGHDLAINSLAFSRNSRLVVSGSADKTIRIWSVSKGKCVRILKGHGSAITFIAVSHDSKLVASASNDNTIKVWQMATGQLLKTIDQPSGIISVCFSRNSTKLVSSSFDEMIRAWDIQTARIERRFSSMTLCRVMTLSHDSKILLFGSKNGNVVVMRFPPVSLDSSGRTSAELVTPSSRGPSQETATESHFVASEPRISQLSLDDEYPRLLQRGNEMRRSRLRDVFKK